jgi:hypothetical protein
VTIVTTTYRPKRPPRKRKAVAIAGPAIVRKPSRAMHKMPAAESLGATEAFPKQPANDDRKPAIVAVSCATVAQAGGTNPKPAIVTTTSRKRAKLERAERAGDQSKIGVIDPEADARVKAFFDRMIRPR